MKIEPVTIEQIKALRQAVVRTHSPMAYMLTGLGDVDLSKGRGVLEGTARCLWTTDRRRITVSGLTDGGAFIIAVSKDPDPECPP